MLPNKVISIFDDNDITKIYGKKFEDLDTIRVASAINDTYVLGYHICNAVVLSKNTKQPIPVYNKVYFCKSKGWLV